MSAEDDRKQVVTFQNVSVEITAYLPPLRTEWQIPDSPVQKYTHNLQLYLRLSCFTHI
jgi:hypothetical protein